MKSYPINRILVALFVLLALFSVAVTGYVSFRNGRRAVNDVSLQLRNEISSRIHDHLSAFLTVPHRINQLNANDIRQGRLKRDDASTLERSFLDQVKTYESVTSIYFGNTAGGLVDAGRDAPAGSLFVISTDDFAAGPFRKYAIDGDGNPTQPLLTIDNFDARKRPWYTGAVTRKDATWSDIYVLFTGHDMAIAASRPVYDPQKQLVGVVAVDLFLSHISDFLRDLKIGKTGLAFIMERTGLMVATSIPEKLFGKPDPQADVLRLHAVQSKSPIIRHAAEALTQRFGEDLQIADSRHLDFKIDGRRYFLRISPIKDTYRLDWLAVVVIPEADFMDQIYNNNRITFLLIIVSLAIAVVAGIIAAHWISHPIAQLNATAQALSAGTGNAQVSDDSRLLEISELTKSFNTMTAQLQQMLGRLTAEIAEHKETETALRSSEERLELVLKGANLGLWDWNIKTGEIIVNDRWAEMLGCTLDEIAPNVNSWENRMHPDDVDVVSAKLNDHLEGRTRYYQSEHRLRTKSGEWKWILDSGKVFSRDATGAPVRALGIHQDITDRKATEKRLYRTLKEKEILLQEIHHRVKNNLAIISSLLNLQVKQYTDEKVRSSLTESQSRIMAMASIHEILYQTKDFSKIHFGDYVRKIVTYLMSLYAVPTDRIRIQYDLNDLHLNIDKAVCCGLIINELVTNALKYAFPDHRQGNIRLYSALKADGEIVLGIVDDGVGMPPGVEWKTPATLGLRLISLMAEQLKGDFEIVSDCGVNAVIRWKP